MYFKIFLSELIIAFLKEKYESKTFKKLENFF